MEAPWVRLSDVARAVGASERTIRRRLAALPADTWRRGRMGECGLTGRKGGILVRGDAVPRLASDPDPCGREGTTDTGHGTPDTGHAAPGPAPFAPGAPDPAPRRTVPERSGRLPFPPPVVRARFDAGPNVIEVAELVGAAVPLLRIAALTGTMDGREVPAESRFRRVVLFAEDAGCLASALAGAVTGRRGPAAPLSLSPDGSEVLIGDAGREVARVAWWERRSGDGWGLSLAELRNGFGVKARNERCGALVVLSLPAARSVALVLSAFADGGPEAVGELGAR